MVFRTAQMLFANSANGTKNIDFNAYSLDLSNYMFVPLYKEAIVNTLNETAIQHSTQKRSYTKLRISLYVEKFK